MTDKAPNLNAQGDRAWFCASPQGNKGPFSRPQMMDLLRRRTIGPDSYIWRDGLDGWVTVRQSGDFPEVSPDGSVGASSAEPDAAPPKPPLSAGQAQDDHLDGVFAAMVRQSWERYARRERSQEVDEVLVGAVITATLDNGYVLIDLNSTGTHHYLRFEELASGCRMVFVLTHLAEGLLTSQVLGHEAEVRIGYGERVKNFGAVWKAVQQEMKGAYIAQPDPGVITIDGDLSSQYIYVEVKLLWDINDYLNPDDPYRVLYPKLTQDIGATLHALRKYLRGRFAAA